MRQRQLFKLLILPSYGSGIATFVVSLVFLGYSAWLFISNNQLFYGAIFGPYGVKTLVWQNSLALNSWQQLLFSSSIAYYIALLGVAIIVGMTVFTVLQAFGFLVRGSSELLHEALDVRRRTSRELFYRLALRVVAIVGWGMYLSAFFSSILPTILSANQVGIERIQAQEYFGAVDSIGAFLGLILALHMHVIFLRTVLLKARVFGGEDDVVVAEAE